MSAGFLINAAGVQHFALLERQLRYVTITVIGVLAQIVSLCVAIGIAISGFGYWALVTAAIVQPLVNTVCVWAVSVWIPGMPRAGIGIGSMLRFGGTITLNGLVVYVAYNLDKVLIGRFGEPTHWAFMEEHINLSIFQPRLSIRRSVESRSLLYRGSSTTRSA